MHHTPDNQHMDGDADKDPSRGAAGGRTSRGKRIGAGISAIALLALAAVPYGSAVFNLDTSSTNREDTFANEELMILLTAFGVVLAGVMVVAAVAPSVLRGRAKLLAAGIPVAVLAMWPLALLLTYGSVLPEKSDRISRCDNPTRGIADLDSSEAVDAVCHEAERRGELSWSGEVEDPEVLRIGRCVERYTKVVFDQNLYVGPTAACTRAASRLDAQGRYPGGASAVVSAARAEQERVEQEADVDVEVPAISGGNTATTPKLPETTRSR